MFSEQHHLSATPVHVTPIPLHEPEKHSCGGKFFIAEDFGTLKTRGRIEAAYG